MLRGYRGIILALAGLVLAGAQQPAKQAKAATSSQQAKSSTEATATPTKTPEPSYRPYANRYSDACYEDQNHDTADLCAQWRAAIAAEKAAKEARIATIAAIIGTILSLATVIGLIVTIWQTHGALGEARRGNRLNLIFERRSRRESRKAADDQERALAIAQRNADIAEMTVKETQRIGEAQVRCYISAVSARIAFFATGEQYFYCTVKNSGRSPAMAVTLQAKLSTFCTKTKETRTWDVRPDAYRFEFQVASGGERELGGFVFRDKLVKFESDAIAGNTLLLTLYATISGKDVFGKPFSVDAKFTAMPNKMPGDGTTYDLSLSAPMIETK